MAERTVLAWTATNWITVVLMVTIGMAVVGFISTALRTFAGSATADDTAA